MPINSLRSKLLTGVCILALTLGGCQSMPNGDELAAQGEDAKLFGQIAGALAGILIGSQIGSGTGRLVAVAGGALLGAWLGSKIAGELNKRDREEMGDATTRALDEPTDTGGITWNNPKTGNSGRVTPGNPYVSTSRNNRAAGIVLPEPLDTDVQLEPRRGIFLTQTNTAARVRPSLAARQTAKLSSGSEVDIIGKVSGENWYLASRNEKALGYVPAADLVVLETVAQSGSLSQREPNPRVCRKFTQMIALANGRTDSVEGTACRAADGTWEYLDS